MKRIAIALLACLPVFAAGTVGVSINPLGPQNPPGGSPENRVHLITITWVGDSVNGTVPATVININQFPQLSGYRLVSIEIQPGTPSPSTNYSITLTDAAGIDILSGNGANLSATVASYTGSLLSPPLTASPTFNLSGNSVASAKGTINLYFAPLSQVAAARGLPATLPGNNPFTGTMTIANANKTIYWDGNVYPQTSAGLQNAINAACNGTVQGRVILSAFGTFSISGVTVPSLCTIEGMGEGQTILQLPASSAAAASVLVNSNQAAGNTGIYLHDFTIDGNKAGQANTGQFGINFVKVANSTLFHIECRNSVGNAASCVQWATSAGGANSEDHDNTVEFCYFHDNGSSAVNNADGLAIGGVRVRIVGLISSNNTDSGVGLQGGTDFVILNGIYQGNTLTGVAFGGPSSTQGVNSRVTIENNVFLSNGASIVSDRTNDLVITGNMMKTTTGTGNKEHILLISTQGVSIVGNRMVGSLSNGITISDLLGTDLTNHATISGNTIEGNNAAGIRINVTNAGALIKNLTISGNTVMNNSQSPTNTIDGLSVTPTQPASVVGMAIEGNIFSDDQGSPTQRYGIAMNTGANAPTNVLIGPNQAVGNATGSFINLPTDANSIAPLGVPPVAYADNLLTDGTQALAWKQIFSYAKVWKETTAPSGVAADDICYGDSTAHNLRCNFNNTGFGPVVSAAPCTTSQRSEAAADNNLLTCAIPAQAGSYRIRFVMEVSAANAATLGWTATWTDSNGGALAPANLALFQAGQAAPALTFTTSSGGDFHGYADIDVNSAATPIVVKLTFSGTSFAAKASATVERII